MRKIELLSPAKTAEHGIQAISHGADAVYIGAPQFGARANASNSLQDIEQVVKFAHKYYAKVYVALNTILTDEELEQAEKIIYGIYNIGADALIIQDMGITQLDLPPIALHASTQMNNRTVEKVQYLEKIGFQQVVLARELNLDQIREISENTSVRLEGFVHGALCVCFNGQCYLSQHLMGRSANRGICAQPCRLPYSLVDGNGRTIIEDKYLLSMKDLNLSEYLQEYIDAGISSLKIEGRLKDIDYVKNITAFYRRKLDEIIDGGNEYRASSEGKCRFYFTPNVEKSFHRGSTDYFLHGRNRDICSYDTPKSFGERIGVVTSFDNRSITVKTDKQINNGDGMCCMSERNGFHGFKVNRAEGNRIFPAERITLGRGTVLYRNYDQEFQKQLSKKSAERKIPVSIHILEKDDVLRFCVLELFEGELSSCESDDRCCAHVDFPKHDIEGLSVAKNVEAQRQTIKEMLGKIGNTIFEPVEVLFEDERRFYNRPGKFDYFLPKSFLTDVRRMLVSQLEFAKEKEWERYAKAREICIGSANFKLKEAIPSCTDNSCLECYVPRYVEKTIDYKGNVQNKKARLFYEKHGVEAISDSFEKNEPKHAELMRCKHCIRYMIGACKKEKKASKITEPLYLKDGKGRRIRLRFDCDECEMVLEK